ncbi:heterokaryon incompatibility protein-domain-containing protein [Biscogniauxia mediterranea]|nr:heterokaryon incompatibility protein-domain-containing protein [Biscogniauxia mediterranea]
MPEDNHADDAVVLPDTSEPLGQVRDRDAKSQSIISAILDIQRFAVTRENWIKSLECLYLPAEEDEEEDEPGGKRRWVDNGPSIASYVAPVLRRSYLDPVSDPEGGRDYVAVSYTWDPSEEEAVVDQGVNSYRVESRRAGESSMPSRVRDVVWDRVLRYAEYVECDNIWIDRECIDQSNQSEQETAIQNMHLVYSLSRKPVALLTRSIKTAQELDLLASLLLEEVRPKDEAALLRLLDDITSDRWWTRAWTFQEDYRASTRMVLLIPHVRNLEDRKQAIGDLKNRPLFGDLPGELRIKSTDFRAEVTNFCLEYRKRSGPASVSVCDKILKVAGKYNILLQEEGWFGLNFISRSMSPTIFADIGKRGILKESDRLAIAANCCGYTTRLETPALNKNRKSLSLSMLALYLLNGEIIDNDPKRCRGTLKDNIYTYLSKQSLRSFESPISKELTFIKSCRFIDPILTTEGTQTRGHLWKLGKVIRRAPMKREKFRRLPPLDILATELSYPTYGASYQDLAVKLLELTRQTPPSSADGRYQRPWEWRDWMAAEVQNALLEGCSIRLACFVHPNYGPEEYSPYRAIFVSTDEDDDDWANDDPLSPRYVFTSTRPAKKGPTSDIHKHVSLEVDVEWPKPASKRDEVNGCGHGLLKLYIKRWRNGLCFSEGYPQRPVLFPHPPELLARLDQ